MTTFRTLKQQAQQGYRLRDYVTGSVTTGALTNLFIDTSRTEPAGEFDRIDAYVVFTSGALDGTERRITGFSTANQSITYAPATTAVASGVSYAIHKTFNQAMLGQSVNQAFADTFPNRFVNSVATAFELEGMRSLTVPSAAFNANTELVQVERSVGTAVGDRYATLWPGADYQLVDYGASGVSAQIIFAHVGATGWLLRFTGRTANVSLTADTDTTDEPAHLIQLGARKFLALLEGDDAGVSKWTQQYERAKMNYTRNRPTKKLKVPYIWLGENPGNRY